MKTIDILESQAGGGGQPEPEIRLRTIFLASVTTKI